MYDLLVMRNKDHIVGKHVSQTTLHFKKLNKTKLIKTKQEFYEWEQ